MSRVLQLALVVLAGLLCFSTVVRAETGVVQGQVINGTAGANMALSGLPVRLYLFSGNTLKDTQRATTDPHGVFRFEAVPAGPGWVGVAVVEYGGVEYESGLLDLSAGTDFNADIPVYETTTDETSLTVERSHLIIEMGSGQLEVTEAIILSNAGDRSYVGSEEVIPGKIATARVPLPGGAVDVTFSSAEVASAMVRTGQGFVDTRPIVPGQHEYVLSYALPCEGATYNLVKPVIYPTIAIDLLVAAPGAGVDAPALEDLGTREASGASYRHLAGRSLAPGADIVIRFSGLGQPVEKQAVARPGEAPPGVAREPWWLGLVPLLALAGLGPALLLHLQRRGRSDAPLSPREVSAALTAEHERLLARLAELDESHEAGELKEASYRRQRQAAKRRLLGLMLDSQSEKGDRSGTSEATRSGRSPGRTAREKVRKGGRSRRRRS